MVFFCVIDKIMFLFVLISVVPKPVGPKRGRGRPKKNIYPYHTDLHENEDLVVKKGPQTYSGKRKRDNPDSEFDDVDDDEIQEEDDLYEIKAEWEGMDEYSPKRDIRITSGRDQPKRSTRGKHSKFDSDYVYEKIKVEPRDDDDLVKEKTDVKATEADSGKRKRGRPPKVVVKDVIAIDDDVNAKGNDRVGAEVVGNETENTEGLMNKVDNKEKLTAGDVKECLAALTGKNTGLAEVGEKVRKVEHSDTVSVDDKVEINSDEPLEVSDDTMEVIETVEAHENIEVQESGVEESDITDVENTVDKDKTENVVTVPVVENAGKAVVEGDGELLIDEETVNESGKAKKQTGEEELIEEIVIESNVEECVIDGKEEAKVSNTVNETEKDKDTGKTAKDDEDKEVIAEDSETVIDNLIKASDKTDGKARKGMVRTEMSDKESMVIMFEETDDGKYGCVLCEATFTEEIEAISHFMDHNQKEVGACDKCGEACETLNDLLVHRKGCLKKNSEHVNKTGAGNEDLEYACEICGQTFKSGQYLYRHMVIHTDMFTCNKCRKTFSRKDSLQKHVLKCCPSMAASYRIHYCDVCHRVFSRQAGLQRHKEKCKSVKCDRCEKTFASSDDLGVHKCRLDYDNESARYACGQCSKKFQSMYYLNQHRKMHSSEHSCKRCGRNFPNAEDLSLHSSLCETLECIRLYGSGRCWQCSISFSNSKQFREHALSHSHPFKCEKCEKRFVKVGSFNSHECSTEIFSCGTCQRSFKNEAGLEKHVKDNECLQYQCSACEQMFHLKSQARDHVQVCEAAPINDKKIVNKKQVSEMCELCGKSFSSRSNLTKHMLLHGEKKYACPHCEKKFHLDVYLKEHVTCVHYNIFKYQCNTCGRMMKSKTGLIAHERIFHSKEGETFSCPKCHKVFNQKGNMKAHMYSHTTERKFACDICVRAFKYPDQLSRHKREHSAMQRLSCSDCHRQFLRGYELKRHIQNEHSGCVYVCHLCSARCCQRHTMVRHFKRKHPSEIELLSKDGYMKSMWKHVSTLGDTNTPTKPQKMMVNIQDTGQVTGPFLLGASGMNAEVTDVEQNIIVPQDSYIIQNADLQAQVVATTDQVVNAVPESMETTVEMIRNEDGTISFNGMPQNSKGQIIILQIVDPEATPEQAAEAIQHLTELATISEGAPVINQVSDVQEGQVTQTGIETIDQGAEITTDNQGVITQNLEDYLQQGIQVSENVVIGKNYMNYKEVQTVLLQKDEPIQEEFAQSIVEGDNKIKILPMAVQNLGAEEQTGLQIMEESEDLQDDLQPIPECIASTETVQLTETISTT